MRAVKAVGPSAESRRICRTVRRRAAQHGIRYLSCARRFRLNSAPKLMQLLDITLPTLAENLALDDALLEEAEQADPVSASRETLRIWQPSAPMVVLGRSSRRADEVNLAACRRLGVPIFRRSSGGAAIAAGPGCLMYTLVLSYENRPFLRHIHKAHRFVLARLVEALRPLCRDVEAAGTSDLTLRGRKFSGNSMRCRREHLLYHGTLLYDFPLEKIAECLRSPPRQPAYRNGRDHVRFVTNFPAGASELRQAIQSTWQADSTREDWPRRQVQTLVVEKFLSPAWNERF